MLWPDRELWPITTITPINWRLQWAFGADDYGDQQSGVDVFCFPCIELVCNKKHDDTTDITYFVWFFSMNGATYTQVFGVANYS